MEIEKEIAKAKSKGITYVGYVLLVIAAAVTVIGFLFYEDIYAPDGFCQSKDTGSSLLNAVLRLMPKILGTMQALFVALLVLYVVCTVIKKVFQGTPRKITIGRLTNSIVKVVIWVAAVIAVLAVWGFNVGALIASAGVVTLIIGLGMQSLIADVVAGIFLVCDGTMEVGDVITIDGWRGTVQEIGIRNTKLINYSGDIRVCNNSTIKVFVNQSRETSYPLVTIGIPYGEDLKKVEKLFNDHREQIKAKLPLVTDGPDYLGVDSLSDSSVDLLFGAKCNENDFFAVQRKMRIELKTFFEEHGICVPFPQVVVHKAEEEEKEGK